MTSHGSAPEIIIITGMSGAGRSTAAKSLEDLDWFVADNLPPAMLPTMLDLARRARGPLPKIAAVVDVRSRAFSTDLKSAIAELTNLGARPYVVFLEASDETLVRRFENVRRPDQLQSLRAQADLVLDTSALNIHDLRSRMRDTFGEEDETAIRVTVLSFGFKHGLPLDADMVVDCRFLPNPHWVPDLAPQTGQAQPVRDFVLGQPGVTDFLRAYTEVVEITLAGYERSGKHFVTLAVGCTGGKHRSVVMSEEIVARLAGSWPGVPVTPRDLGRE